MMVHFSKEELISARELSMKAKGRFIYNISPDKKDLCFKLIKIGVFKHFCDDKDTVILISEDCESQLLNLDFQYKAWELSQKQEVVQEKKNNWANIWLPVLAIAVPIIMTLVVAIFL